MALGFEKPAMVETTTPVEPTTKATTSVEGPKLENK